MSTSILYKTFEQLSGQEVYAIAQLRQNVFILEQNCLYPDLDGFDSDCIHTLLYSRSLLNSALNTKETKTHSEELLAYLRIIPPSEHHGEMALGRVVVKKNYRGQGLSRVLLRAGIKKAYELYPNAQLVLSGQAHLKSLYESLGFSAQGAIYDEDGIPHQKFSYQLALINQ